LYETEKDRMKQIPQTENALVLRTDFSNQAAWEEIWNYSHTFIIVTDQTATSHPDHPLLIVDLYDSSGREFRAVPSQIQGIENNLSIANMDFEEFADSVHEDGIFRGFPEN
jgi:hypothetical protein